MMIAREGLPFILIALSLTLIAVWAGTRWDSIALWVVSSILALLTISVTFFFRDPARSCEDLPGLIVSPADGTVLSVDTLANYPVTGPQTIKIAIFLSVANVHVNRVPVTGKVDYVKYVPGKYFAAYLPKASDLNEHTEIAVSDESGQKVVFKQIAGLVARRIVCKISQGEDVKAGERFGLIRFGSRAEVYLPNGSKIMIAKGDKVKGGQTTLAHLPDYPAGLTPLQ